MIEVIIRIPCLCDATIGFLAGIMMKKMQPNSFYRQKG